MYGGSFDPPHLAHRAVALAALGELDLDELRVVPLARPPHKSVPPAPARERVLMLEALFAGDAEISVDARELRRPGPSYTADTLRSMVRAEPGAAFFLVVGADEAALLRTWHQAGVVGALATLVVATRPAAPASAALPDGAFRLEHVAPPISSTEVRRRVAAGADVRDLVGERVAVLIAGFRLYAAGAPRLAG